jgi:hypothetical protein
MDRRILVPLVALVLAALACGGSAPPAEPPPSASTEIAVTPAPVATPTPAMLTVRGIEAKRKELTDLQWQTYAEEIVGEPIRFSGNVLEVREDGRVQISDGKGFLTVVILYGVPLDVAAGLNKDQAVEGEGTVREVDTTLTLAVWIDVEMIQ